ncbi:hypothetical protein QBC37DRAFT_44383 [Rhypophila decipiens]|uniref:Uncharacterized protein n=1 Tax=Rhypophila decipiens TaxID=261697 RepID=A0AAN6Y089_9PEZI|nr:hypothetical protein QBC37DRAFT_44383 [Rhypophila decipiens]
MRPTHTALILILHFFAIFWYLLDLANSRGRCSRLYGYPYGIAKPDSCFDPASHTGDVRGTRTSRCLSVTASAKNHTTRPNRSLKGAQITEVTRTFCNSMVIYPSAHRRYSLLISLTVRPYLVAEQDITLGVRANWKASILYNRYLRDLQVLFLPY